MPEISATPDKPQIGAVFYSADSSEALPLCRVVHNPIIGNLAEFQRVPFIFPYQSRLFTKINRLQTNRNLRSNGNIINQPLKKQITAILPANFKTISFKESAVNIFFYCNMPVHVELL